MAQLFGARNRLRSQRKQGDSRESVACSVGVMMGMFAFEPNVWCVRMTNLLGYRVCEP